MADTIGSFIGNTVGEAAAFAAGIAVGPLLAPLLRALENETWSQYPDNPLAAQTVAQGVAEGKITAAEGAAEATLTGYSGTAFANLVTIMQNGPGVATGFDLLRRGQISTQDFATVLIRAGLEEQWITAIQAASLNGLAFQNKPLSPPDVALGMVRNNLPNTDSSGNTIFPPGLDSSGSTVPQAPQPAINPETEAAMSGYDLERFTVLANNVGLPPGVIQGLEMLNRGIITEADFALLIEQSDTRIAWGPFILQLRNAILTAHEAAELHVRGWITQEQMYAIGALSGQSQANMDLLYDNIGRPLAEHQITTGLSRGGTYDGTPQLDIPSPYLEAFQESNIRPEWYSLAYANRYTYPSYFVLKAIAQAGVIDVTQATTYLLYQGWEPDLAAFTAESFFSSSSTTSSPVKSANTSLVTAARKAYVAGASTTAQATADLTAAGIAAGDITTILDAWNQIIEIEARTTPPATVAPPGGG